MPKLYFGSRGGMYYRKNGRKVYVKQKSSFGQSNSYGYPSSYGYSNSYGYPSSYEYSNSYGYPSSYGYSNSYGYPHFGGYNSYGYPHFGGYNYFGGESFSQDIKDNIKNLTAKQIAKEIEKSEDVGGDIQGFLDWLENNVKDKYKPKIEEVKILLRLGGSVSARAASFEKPSKPSSKRTSSRKQEDMEKSAAFRAAQAAVASSLGGGPRRKTRPYEMWNQSDEGKEQVISEILNGSNWSIVFDSHKEVVYDNVVNIIVNIMENIDFNTTYNHIRNIFKREFGFMKNHGEEYEQAWNQMFGERKDDPSKAEGASKIESEMELVGSNITRWLNKLSDSGVLPEEYKPYHESINKRKMAGNQIYQLFCSIPNKEGKIPAPMFAVKYSKKDCHQRYLELQNIYEEKEAAGELKIADGTEGLPNIDALVEERAQELAKQMVAKELEQLAEEQNEKNIDKESTKLLLKYTPEEIKQILKLIKPTKKNNTFLGKLKSSIKQKLAEAARRVSQRISLTPAQLQALQGMPRRISGRISGAPPLPPPRKPKSKEGLSTISEGKFGYYYPSFGYHSNFGYYY